MEKALNKVGSFWISRKAKEEIASIGQDLTTFSNTIEEKAKWVFNKLKGDLLSQVNHKSPCQNCSENMASPSGIFPKNVVCYEFDRSKSKLVVHLPSVCEVSFKDSSVLRYSTRVKASLTRGKLSGIEGMKTKLLIWVKVTSVAVEGYRSDKIRFTAGVKKSRSRDVYEMPRDAVGVEEF